MPTIVDVAKHAGVSKSTVSLVLNNSPLVREETRELVQNSIREIGYIPNNIARGLITHKSYNFGVLILIEDDPINTYEFDYQTGLFSQNITSGILEGLGASKYGLITERFCAKSGELPKLLQTKCIDGLFLIGDLGKEKIIEFIRKAGIHCVAVGRKAYGLDTVFTYPGDGVYHATRHLIERGHKRLCFINAPAKYISTPLRLEGFRKAISDAGLDMNLQLALNTEHNTGESGFEALAKAEVNLADFDGLIGGNDMITLGALRYCYEKRVRVPDGISLISAEDSILCGYSSPAVSAININKEELGRKAAEIMLKKLEDSATGIEEVNISMRLVERESVR